jgi:hypothetical protein
MILLGRRGQGSFEFIILIGFLFFLLLGTFALVQGKMFTITREKNYASLEKVGNIINTEMTLASSVDGDYSRMFELPYELRQNNYSVYISGPAEISVMIDNYEYVVFLNSNISGEIHKGENLLKKKDGNITINA